MTKRRAAISMSPATASVSRSLKRAAPSITRTPSPASRSRARLGARAAMTPRTWSRTRPKSVRTDLPCTPKAGDRAAAWARRPAAISALSGSRPARTASPPIWPACPACGSTSTTRTPKAAACIATCGPPAPAPMTQMSGLIVSGMPSPHVRPSRRGFDPKPGTIHENTRPECLERIALSTGTNGPDDVHRSLSPAAAFITRSRLALTGKPRLPYKPRDLEQAATLETGPFGRGWPAPRGATTTTPSE